MLMMTYFDDVGDLSVVIKQCRDEKKNLDEQLIWKVTTMLMMMMMIFVMMIVILMMSMTVCDIYEDDDNDCCADADCNRDVDDDTLCGTHY